ncbi:MAG: chemotaxis protein CheW [Firmicutes bacterium]|nr:chemotaxis protein CheW [Bacillota bacterium]
MPNQIQKTKELQLVVFQLGDEEYGIDILRVQEIKRMLAITRVPNAPHFIEGVINLRGQIIPVLDLRRRFKLPVGEITDNSRIMIINVDELTVGMIVDVVLEVISLPLEDISPTPSLVTGINAQFLDGIGKVEGRLLIILNPQQILEVTELDELQELTEDITK